MMNPAESPQLLLTITGIRRETVVGAEAMRDALRGIGANAGLVVTAQAPEWKLQADSAALEFIHESVAQKHELLLGGMGLSRVGTSETKGEFHRLGHHEAQLRLTASRRQLSALGLEPEVFAPDKWMASEETMRAARQQGLLAAADRGRAAGSRLSVPALQQVCVPAATRGGLKSALENSGGEGSRAGVRIGGYLSIFSGLILTAGS